MILGWSNGLQNLGYCPRFDYLCHRGSLSVHHDERVANFDPDYRILIGDGYRFPSPPPLLLGRLYVQCVERSKYLCLKLCNNLLSSCSKCM